ncbi:hypothetical protein [Synechococcus sp. N5]|uniref:hypothetical protein n=1 Tax=Synechococcus sp. N5 TaxID=2575515 RepID=UPI000E0F413E|nr:hypothetical protein [Synechococcus sp. N5]
MAWSDQIRAVFVDPQVIGMDALYQAIGWFLKDGADFDRAYQLVIEARGVEAATWITFCVNCATRFDDTPEESEFLFVLEQMTREHMGMD